MRQKKEITIASAEHTIDDRGFNGVPGVSFALRGFLCDFKGGGHHVVWLRESVIKRAK